MDFRANTLNLLSENGVNEIIFGRTEKYRPIDFDYNTNLKAACISAYIEDVMSDKELSSIHDPDIALEKFATVIFPIMAMCLDFSKNDIPEIDETKGIEEIFNDFYEKGGLPQWLVILDLEKTKKTPKDILFALENVSSAKELPYDLRTRYTRFVETLRVLGYIDTGLTFNSVLPETFYGQIKDFIKFGIAVLAKGYNVKAPSDLLDSIQYAASEYPNLEEEAFKVISKEGIRLRKKIFVMDGYEFKTEKDKNFLRNILTTYKLIRSVYFKNCCFNFDINPFFAGHLDILFQDCRFEKCFGLCGTSVKSMGFYRCNFFNKINLLVGAPKIPYNLTLLECFFEKGSCCSINTLAGKTDNRLTLYIENTFFNGELSILNNSEKEFDITMRNVSFGCPFQIGDLYLSKSSIFENLIFSSIPSIQMDKSRKDLYNAMKSAGLEEKAKELGILPEKIGGNDTEEREYQDALQKGWLNPKQAARFLGKSVRTLQEKRKNDQIQITKESLPFIGEGKDILYPLDALKAYLEQDWNLLKELRKKHWKKD